MKRVSGPAQRILVLGATGTVGSAVTRLLAGQEGVEVIGATRWPEQQAGQGEKAGMPDEAAGAAYGDARGQPGTTARTLHGPRAESARLLDAEAGAQFGSAASTTNRAGAKGARSVNADAGVQSRVRWVAFDYDNPDTFRPAVEGTTDIFMMVRPGDDTPQTTAIPLLERARDAGVGKVVLLSAMGAERRPDFGLRILERYIEDTGFRFVHLRPNWFMQLFTSGPLFLDLATTSGLHLPAGDAAISYIDAWDIAEVAAQVLTDGRWDGLGLTLTGPEALTHAELVETLADATGRELKYVPLTDDQARQGLAAAGFNEARIERLILFYRLVRQGVCAPVSQGVEEITGKRGRRWKEFVRRNVRVWE